VVCLGGKEAVRTDDGIIGFRNGAFGNCHKDAPIAELKTLSEWICWKETKYRKIEGFQSTITRK
jgi:hypothetical protein